ncbi:class I SAM-dependent methyltransferase [Candidatus Parcubacteria bacterium]|jgi:SAM-dependent methyltransferase|nr:class I SAM-dependent methyltransferase [Candidatus Parcubacteria bacterium]MBT3948952.1 class I SAM-dependent methyltransferase [Candidatus Parcubacteria bacterium]
MQEDEYGNMFEHEESYWWYGVLDSIVLFYVRKYVKDKKEDIFILDVGCGTGRMMKKLSAYGDVEGFDYADKAVEFCKKRGLSNVQQQDVNLWNPTSNMYDVVVSLDVLYHKAVKDDVGVLKNIYHSLKPGGIVILNVPAFSILRRIHDRQVSGVRRYRKNKLKNDMEKIGFNIQKATYRLPHVFCILFIKKIFEYFKKDKSMESDLQELPKIVDRSLRAMGMAENKIIPFLSLPFGSSLFIVAKK